MAVRQVALTLNLKPGSPQPILNLFRSLVPASAATGTLIGRNLAKGLAGYRGTPGTAATGPGGGGGSGGLGSTLAGAAGGAIGGGLGLGLAAASGVVAAATLLAETITDAALATVGKASPATMARMNMAWDDMLAVIGRALIPVVELLTAGFRLLGDFLASILPTTAEVREAFGGFYEILGDLRDVLAEIAPILKEAIKWLLQLAGTLISWLAKVITYPVKLLRDAGLVGGAKPLTSSVGAAARPASIQTDAVAFARQTYARILSSVGGGLSPQERQAKAAEDSVKLLQDIKNELAQQGGQEGNLSERVEDAAKLGLGRYA
jgi:hypothetical protein